MKKRFCSLFLLFSCVFLVSCSNGEEGYPRISANFPYGKDAAFGEFVGENMDVSELTDYLTSGPYQLKDIVTEEFLQIVQNSSLGGLSFDRFRMIVYHNVPFSTEEILLTWDSNSDSCAGCGRSGPSCSRATVSLSFGLNKGYQGVLLSKESVQTDPSISAVELCSYKIVCGFEVAEEDYVPRFDYCAYINDDCCIVLSDVYDDCCFREQLLQDFQSMAAGLKAEINHLNNGTGSFLWLALPVGAVVIVGGAAFFLRKKRKTPAQ